MAGRFARRRMQGLAVLLGCGLTIALAGCETMPVAATVARGDIRAAIARGQLTSPRAATVSLVSLEGAPADVEGRFRQALNTAAADREITLTDPVSARYLVRGYLSAFTGEQGVTVSYTYDVFDGKTKRREQRVADTLVLPVAAADPWSALTPAALASLVGSSADDLAVALAGTPEAQAGRIASADPSPSLSVH